MSLSELVGPEKPRYGRNLTLPENCQLLFGHPINSELPDLTVKNWFKPITIPFLIEFFRERATGAIRAYNRSLDAEHPTHVTSWVRFVIATHAMEDLESHLKKA